MSGSCKANGAYGRYAPGSPLPHRLFQLDVRQRAQIEAIFDIDINDEFAIKIGDALSGVVPSADRRLKLKDWKERNTKQIRRLKEGLPSDDTRVVRLAFAHFSAMEHTELQALKLIQKQIRADEQWASQLKKEGRLYDRDLSGEPVNDFCWIEAPHPQTEAIIAGYKVFEELGADVSTGDNRTIDSIPDEDVVPTPFVSFCYAFIYRESWQKAVRSGKTPASLNKRVVEALDWGRKYNLLK